MINEMLTKIEAIIEHLATFECVQLMFNVILIIAIAAAAIGVITFIIKYLIACVAEKAARNARIQIYKSMSDEYRRTGKKGW